MKSKIYFLGNTKDFSLAEKLYTLLCEEFTTSKKVAVVGKDFEVNEKFDVVTYEFGTALKADIADETYTYSIGQSNADVCGFNFQKREVSRSLELLSGSFMGRVNIPVNSKFTEEAVLYCSAGLVAAGFNLAQILKAINTKIS